MFLNIFGVRMNKLGIMMEEEVAFWLRPVN